MNQDKSHMDSCCSEFAEYSRRRFLARTGLLSAGLVSGAMLPKVAFGKPGSSGTRDVMVHVFLRGGIDGLTFIVPHGDNALYSARPNIAVPKPGQQNGAIDLDGFFGLNPNAAALTTPYSAGHLAVVHAAGSTDPTRSHFDAMKAMEGGVPNQSLIGVSTGWLGRHLAGTAPSGTGLLRGMALEDVMPLHMTGADATLPVSNPSDFEFPGRLATLVERRQTVENMFLTAEDPLDDAATSTFATLDLLAAIDFENYQTSGSKPYPGSVTGQKLRITAALIKAEIDIEAIGIDSHGWDLHEGLGPITGPMANLMADLTNSLEAFYLDLVADGYNDRVVTLLMSEFGRRVEENASLGTDHGHGNMMLAMGGNIAGGQVFANWPGLDPGSLVDGDLDITIDYRDVTGEILEKRMDNTDLSTIFPNHTPQFIGITV